MATDKHIEVVANFEKVNAMTKVLLDTFNQYLTENPQSATDVFMSVHNFHRVLVLNLAKEWEKEGIPIYQTYRMADMTFRKAMREERRNV